MRRQSCPRLHTPQAARRRRCASTCASQHWRAARAHHQEVVLPLEGEGGEAGGRRERAAAAAGGCGGPTMTAEESTVQAGSSCCMVRHGGRQVRVKDAMACCGCRRGQVAWVHETCSRRERAVTSCQAASGRRRCRRWAARACCRVSALPPSSCSILFSLAEHSRDCSARASAERAQLLLRRLQHACARGVPLSCRPDRRLSKRTPEPAARLPAAAAPQRCPEPGWGRRRVAGAAGWRRGRHRRVQPARPAASCRSAGGAVQRRIVAALFQLAAQRGDQKVEDWRCLQQGARARGGGGGGGGGALVELGVANGLQQIHRVSRLLRRLAYSAQHAPRTPSTTSGVPPSLALREPLAGRHVLENKTRIRRGSAEHAGGR